MSPDGLVDPVHVVGPAVDPEHAHHPEGPMPQAHHPATHHHAGFYAAALMPPMPIVSRTWRRP
jgi:hypothetical protein